MSLITWNPEDKGSTVVLHDNNLRAVMGSGTQIARATKGVSEGKWYWEIYVHQDTNLSLGIATKSRSLSNWHLNTGYFRDGRRDLSSNLSTGFADSYSSGDYIGIALDLENGRVKFYKNGVFQGFFFDQLLQTVTNEGELFPALSKWGSAGVNETLANFGASEFEMVSSNTSEWERLKMEGFYPYDTNSAIWNLPKTSLIKSKNTIYTLTENNQLEQTDIQYIPNREDFQSKGIENFSALVTPRHSVLYDFQEEKTNIVDEGDSWAESEFVVRPEEYGRKIKRMRVKR